jgi:hypothetical protein
MTVAIAISSERYTIANFEVTSGRDWAGAGALV